VSEVRGILGAHVPLRRLAWFLPLPFLIGLGAFASVRVADRVGAALALALDSVAAFMVSSARQAPEPESEGFDSSQVQEALIPVAVAASGTGSASKQGGSRQHGSKAKSKAKAGERVVFVDAKTVLRLAESRARPRGVPVKADGPRPAGLRLVRVSELGIGVQDGDVLTRAVGQPALSSSAIVQAVLVARARGDKVLQGEFWRGGERWLLRVEQPYLPKP
jgi:hypothetical protein